MWLNVFVCGWFIVKNGCLNSLNLIICVLLVLGIVVMCMICEFGKMLV